VSLRLLLPGDTSLTFTPIPDLHAHAGEVHMASKCLIAKPGQEAQVQMT
jgi:hypothetical protein